MKPRQPLIRTGRPAAAAATALATATALLLLAFLTVWSDEYLIRAGGNALALAGIAFLAAALMPACSRAMKSKAMRPARVCRTALTMTLSRATRRSGPARGSVGQIPAARRRGQKARLHG